MKKGKRYSEVLRELEEIIERLGRGEVPIDDLEETIKAASEKIRHLRQRLKATEAEITRVLDLIEEGRDTSGPDQNPETEPD